MNLASSPVDQILNRMEQWKNNPALFFRGQTVTYSELLQSIESWTLKLKQDGIKAGTVCAVYGDFSPQTAALFFALMKTKAIIVPFTSDVENEMNQFAEMAGVEYLYHFSANDEFIGKKIASHIAPSLVEEFRKKNHPGLIVFTSGSTGKPKGILHDCEQVMHKFVTIRKSWKTILFLLMDHFGGFNTFLSSFAYGGVAICLEARTPECVAKTIAESKANLLPTTPTFLNLLIAGKFYLQNDFSSIELITYGTEMMPETTLEQMANYFPAATLKQTYGMSELGVLQSKSESKDSLWVKVGGDGFQTKIIDNILWVKSISNMVGYLNETQPFDEDGWLCTGDEVEVKGEYIRFKGRKSEIINVGGKKVFPSEVESIILSADNIKDATVYSQPHPLMGQVVYAKITTIEDEDSTQVTERLRKYCTDRLAKYKVPLRFILTPKDDNHHNARFKKDRIKNHV